ncbi:hypothetical protein [Algoriphagus sp. CAU 1675]|uniref:hypothetical protein n=1 Tax=Algoriphagus sp. CAU 1675 TaxID=3032597 RepID=UPI0023DB7A4D|nr:hypothetical protein [Algoriphagus sp. CAU 1675]MDF2157460.1 hypothetical protein [Algoriphagus sp. CAU 1675]
MILFLFCFWELPLPAQELRFLKDAEVVPSKLEYFRDSVQFSVKGTIPIESVVIPRNPELRLIFKAGEKSLDLGSLFLRKGLANYSYEQDFKLAFEPWMGGANLELIFFQGKRKTGKPYEKRVISQGVKTTAFLAKIGQVIPGEDIPVLGMMFSKRAEVMAVQQTAEFTILFDPGTAEFEESDNNLNQLNQLRTFLMKNPVVSSVKVTGLQSPEKEEGRNSKLGMDRALVVKDLLISENILLREDLIEVNSRWNDWFDLRLLLTGYDKISSALRERYYSILMEESDFLSQQLELKKIPGFEQVSRDLYPNLRAAKIEIVSGPNQGLAPSEYAVLKEELDKPSSVSSLSFDDWVKGAEESPRLEDKALIYSRMTELFNSSMPYNNLAVVKMRLAQRTVDPDLREKLWSEGIRLLEQGIRIEPHPYLFYNMGQILALKGAYWEAYIKLSEAASKSRDPEFLKTNEGLRGALDILRGDYKLAVLRFDYPFSDSKDLFNKGLAYYLAGDFVNASLAFEESVLKNREYGFGYYGLALIAANSGQFEVASIQLEKALAASSFLSEYILTDPNFEEFRNREGFFDWYKKNKSSK